MKSRWSHLASLLGVLTFSPAVADEFTEYRIPPHRRMDWNATLQVDGLRSAYGNSTTEARGREFRGYGNSFVVWVADSDPTWTRLQLFGSALGIGDWSTIREQTPFVYEASDDREIRNVGERLQLIAEHRRYPWRTPVGFEITASVSGQYEQRWLDDRVRILQEFGGSQFFDRVHTTMQVWSYVNGITTDVAAGWGRVRDATAVYEAFVLERRLRETGALIRPLSSAARQKLVALLAVRDEYEAHREHAVKTLWQKIEEILAEDGALREGGLDARSVLRAGENVGFSGISGDVLPRAPFARRVGVFVGPVLSDQHLHFLTRIDQSRFQESAIDGTPNPPFRIESHSRFDQSRDEVFAGARAEIDRPIGMRWQAGATARALFPVRVNRDGQQVTASAGLAYVLAERWVGSADVQYLRSLLKGSRDRVFDDRWSVDYGLSASYYLEDDLQLSLFLREDQSHDALAGPSGGVDQRHGQVLLAVTYRILGRFSAPGIIPAETLRGR